MLKLEKNVTLQYILKKFCRIAGKENAAKWALKKYLESIDTLLENNYYNCDLIEEIRYVISRKTNVKAQYIKMPKWERLVCKVKRELKGIKENGIYEGALNGSTETIDTIPAEKGMQKIEIKIKEEPEYHSPHVHIIYGSKECSIRLSNPKEIFEGSKLPPKVLKKVTKRIKKIYNKLLNRYYEKNPTHWQKES